MIIGSIKRKKAVSSIVATVLLLLITVVAVGIIWGLIMPLLQEKIMEFSQSCINVKVRINTKEGYTCFHAGRDEASVMISRGPEDFELYAVQIILAGEGTSEKFEFAEDTVGVPGINADKTYRINLTDSDLAGKIIDTAAVVPVVKIGSSTRICGITSRVKISSCI